jgi:hypothetical protein
MYWKHFPQPPPYFNVGAAWVSLGCCAGSEPAAVSRASDQIDLFFIGATSGKLIRIAYRHDTWHDWHFVDDGEPSAGIKTTVNGFIGPAVTASTPDSFDVFVVRRDGRLALKSFGDGAWRAWRTLGQNYNVTARPAAVALHPNQIQLAINESTVNLFEPSLQFLPFAFTLGNLTGIVARGTPPALAKRDDIENRYRVIAVNSSGRLSHRFQHGAWRDIGGIPMPGTGAGVVSVGEFGAYIVINGDEVVGCNDACVAGGPATGGVSVQPSGLWMRIFR